MNNIEGRDSHISALPLVAGILLIVDGGFKILLLVTSLTAAIFAYIPSFGFEVSY